MKNSMNELLTTKEAAVLLSCDPSTVNKYVRKGKLRPAQRVGGKLFFEKEVIKSLKKPLTTKNPNFNRRGQTGLNRSHLKEIIEKWGVNARDTASADIQIGIYTEKIFKLEETIKQIPTEDTDFRDMRYKLLWHVGERRKLLKYLEMSDFRRYLKAVEMIKRESA